MFFIYDNGRFILNLLHIVSIEVLNETGKDVKYRVTDSNDTTHNITVHCFQALMKDLRGFSK